MQDTSRTRENVYRSWTTPEFMLRSPFSRLRKVGKMRLPYSLIPFSREQCYGMQEEELAGYLETNL